MYSIGEKAKMPGLWVLACGMAAGLYMVKLRPEFYKEFDQWKKPPKKIFWHECHIIWSQTNDYIHRTHF